MLTLLMTVLTNHFDPALGLSLRTSREAVISTLAGSFSVMPTLEQTTPRGLWTGDISIGQRFQLLGDDAVYMLCQVRKGIVLLINVETGNRYDDYFASVENPYNLTRSEADKVFGGGNWSIIDKDNIAIALEGGAL
jgi:hypothetical protein